MGAEELIAPHSNNVGYIAVPVNGNYQQPAQGYQQPGYYPPPSHHHQDGVVIVEETVDYTAFRLLAIMTLFFGFFFPLIWLLGFV